MDLESSTTLLAQRSSSNLSSNLSVLIKNILRNTNNSFTKDGIRCLCLRVCVRVSAVSGHTVNKKFQISDQTSEKCFRQKKLLKACFFFL